MKKLLSIIALITILLCGCSVKVAPPSNIQSNASETRWLDISDSVVEFNVYPENVGYECIDKFARREFSNLTETQKSVYIALDNAIFQMKTGFIELGKCSERDMEVAYHAVRHDRPEYFWIPSEYSLKTVGEERQICFAKSESDWLYTKQQRKAQEKKIKLALSQFAATLKANMSQYDREKAAHDWIISKTTYDQEALKDSKKNIDAWSVVGALVYGKAVCEGYSKVMQMLMFMVGIDCGLVTGVTDAPHMWNYVNIDSAWYHVDLTADDGKDRPYYFFFNVTTEYMLRSRTIDDDFSDVSDEGLELGQYNCFVPLCYKLDSNYHTVNSLIITNKEQASSTIVSMICDAINNNKNYVEFAVSPQMSFVFGKQDAAKVFDIERCIMDANAELPEDKRIYSYSYGGVNGALGFMIAW